MCPLEKRETQPGEVQQWVTHSHLWCLLKIQDFFKVPKQEDISKTKVEIKLKKKSKSWLFQKVNKISKSIAKLTRRTDKERNSKSPTPWAYRPNPGCVCILTCAKSLLTLWKMRDLNNPVIKKPNHPKQNIDSLHNLALWKSTKERRKVNRNSTHYSPEKERIGLKQRKYKIKTGDN